MAKITEAALRKRGWKHKRRKGINPKYWYYKGKHPWKVQNAIGTDNYKIDQLGDSGIYIFDIPCPYSDIGGWSALREVNSIEQLDALVKSLEMTIQ